MKSIDLKNGHTLLVDDEDFEYLHNRYIRVEKGRDTFYAYIRRYKSGSKNRQRVAVHRLVMGEPENMLIDHWDRNGLNCQKGNLRLCTQSQNQANRRLRQFTGKTSKYKGVCVLAGEKKYRAQIRDNGKRINLGSFELEEEAARAYDEAALRYYGEFALTNHQLGLI